MRRTTEKVQTSLRIFFFFGEGAGGAGGLVVVVQCSLQLNPLESSLLGDVFQKENQK